MLPLVLLILPVVLDAFSVSHHPELLRVRRQYQHHQPHHQRDIESPARRNFDLRPQASQSYESVRGIISESHPASSSSHSHSQETSSLVSDLMASRIAEEITRLTKDLDLRSNARDSRTPVISILDDEVRRSIPRIVARLDIPPSPPQRREPIYEDNSQEYRGSSMSKSADPVKSIAPSKSAEMEVMQKIQDMLQQQQQHLLKQNVENVIKDQLENLVKQQVSQITKEHLTQSRPSSSSSSSESSSRPSPSEESSHRRLIDQVTSGSSKLDNEISEMNFFEKPSVGDSDSLILPSSSLESLSSSLTDDKMIDFPKPFHSSPPFHSNPFPSHGPPSMNGPGFGSGFGPRFGPGFFSPGMPPPGGLRPRPIPVGPMSGPFAGGRPLVPGRPYPGPFPVHPHGFPGSLGSASSLPPGRFVPPSQSPIGPSFHSLAAAMYPSFYGGPNQRSSGPTPGPLTIGSTPQNAGAEKKDVKGKKIKSMLMDFAVSSILDVGMTNLMGKILGGEQETK